MVMKLLIVDDSESDILVLDKFLEIEAVELDLKTARDLESALLEVVNFKPDAVLLDINLGGISGLEVLKQIRSNPAYDNVLVVMCTGSNIRNDINEAFLGGADGYVIKPVSFEEWHKVAARLKKMFEVNEKRYPRSS